MISGSTENSSISFRISFGLWINENRFHELMGVFEKYRGVTDEVTFFTSETHSCLSLDLIQERAKILKSRMVQVRKFGYRAGINHLTTIGFFKENADQSLKENYGERTYLDGYTDVGGRCSNDPAMQEYIQGLYRSLVAAEPDYIWMDDDIHSGNCFCNHCLDKFAKIVGRRYSREELQKAFNEGSIESKLAFRKYWLEHSRQTFMDLIKLVEKTIHTVSPKMPIGLMTGDRFPEGYDFDLWAKILSGSAGADVMWRPGEGFWSDERPIELAEKVQSVGRQVAFLPDNVMRIQSEVESFVYQPLKKSKKMTALEPAVYIAAGAMGAAFNILTSHDQPLDEYDPMVAEIRKTRPFYDLLVKTFSRSKPQGIYTGWNKDTFVATNLSQGNWFNNDPKKIAGSQACEIFEIGLPAAYRYEDSQATILAGESARSFSPEALEKILSGGVYLDAAALTTLNQMGYGELTGFVVEKYYEKDSLEQWTDHPFNGSFAGQRRDCRQAFRGCGESWGVPAAALIPQSQKSQILSRLINYAHAEIAPCTSGIFENKLGGRIYVAGYCPWSFMQYLSKSTQMKSIFRWLSKESLPDYIGSYHKINLWSRKTLEGKQTMALLNSSLDADEHVELMIKTNGKEIIVYDMNCQSTSLKAAGNSGGYQRFILPEIPSWQMRLVCEK
jgi:hypothetical protein